LIKTDLFHKGDLVKVVSRRHQEVFNESGKVQDACNHSFQVVVKLNKRMDNHPEYNFYKTELLNITTLTWTQATYLQHGIRSLHEEQIHDLKLALPDDYNILHTGSKDGRWFEDQKAR
jgi:hypothetical protein